MKVPVKFLEHLVVSSTGSVSDSVDEEEDSGDSEEGVTLRKITFKG